MEMAPYMLSAGNEKAASEKERMPSRELTERLRRRLGKSPKKDTAMPWVATTNISSEMVIHHQLPCIG